RHRLSRIIADPVEPIHQLINESAARELLAEKSDYGKPWFGQLMAGPQLMAYLLQINFWLKRYDISIQL
ncbi:MAG: asparagine synthetase B, partial [Faecalispora jeddahensis]